MAVSNPFRYRATEQQRQQSAFHRTFGFEMLEVLPTSEDAWNRLVVLRSAPGAGKTSILRLLSADSLRQLLSNAASDEATRGLRNALDSIGAIGEGEIKILGIMISVNKDYRSVIDLGPNGSGHSDKVFLKLLDARLITHIVESILTAKGLDFEDSHRVRFVPRKGIGGERARTAIAKLSDDSPVDHEGGISGSALIATARGKERRVIELLDSLVEVDWVAETGHARLYSLPLLSNVDIEVDGELQFYRPVLLFDDVHDLAHSQRDVLYEELVDRTHDVGRWIAERQEAVPDEELLTGHIKGRDFRLVQLETELLAGNKGGNSQRLSRILTNVANARATIGLSSIDIMNTDFTSLLLEGESIPQPAAASARSTTRDRVVRLASMHPQYADWVGASDEQTANSDSLASATHWREIEILMERDLARSQPTLFDIPVDSDKAAQMSSSGTRAAARLFLANENNLPYYYGPEVLADLSSRNIEQYLGVAGDQFDLIVSAVTARSRRGSPFLTAQEQDQRIRRSSKQLWAAIPSRVPHGTDVLALLHAIADHSRHETYRASAPYGPGVTGTAIENTERKQLLGRLGDKGARYDRLRRALSSAVANNLLEMSPEPNRTVGPQWAVLYLNRLLLPHFDLPLQRGGYREQSISKMARRLELTVTVDTGAGPPNPLTKLRDVEGWPK
jgi:hypothetical protein